MTDNPRRAAADILFKVYKNGAYLNEELNNLRRNRTLSNADMRFVNEVTNGVIKYKLRLDYIIGKNSSVKVKKIAPYILAILECAVYQIIFMDRVPESAAVNEAVKLTKTKNLSRSSGFVNGVLRSVASSYDDVDYPKTKAEYLSVYYSYPMWLVEHWIEEFGVERTEALLNAFEQRADIVLRCNLLRTDVQKLIESLNNDGCAAEVFSKVGFHINYLAQCSQINDIIGLNSYQDGWFYVQDFAAALTVEALDPKPGMTVMDMCAAPGGKTTHMAEKMNNMGRIFAFDIHSHKIDTINENASRLGIDIISAECGNSAQFDIRFEAVADRVLVDAPCSGLGVLRRKPDIKYSRSLDDIYQLADTGYAILENSAKYVKPGGILVYSTCTIERGENDVVTDRFLAKHPEFKKVALDICDRENDGSITLYPDTDGCDGFYICKMQRVTI